MFEILLKFVSVDMIARLVRTGLQTAGASAVTHGYMTGSQSEAIIGALVTVITTGFTIVSTLKANGGATATPANPTTGGLL